MVTPAGRTRLLSTLLRLGGTITLLAFLAMLMPTDWMAAIHERMGLGEFPRRAVVEYLTRSVAALYGFHGVLLFLLARDPVQHRSIVWFVAVMNVVFGLILIGIDLHAGMPLVWTLFEGPPIVLFGIMIAALNR